MRDFTGWAGRVLSLVGLAAGLALLAVLMMRLLA
jgi:hypothetical protein